MIQGAVRDQRGTNCKLFGGCGDPLDPALSLRHNTIICITEESLKNNNLHAA